MKMTEKGKANLKIVVKAWLSQKQKAEADLSIDDLKEIIQSSLNFFSIDADQEDFNELLQDLEYEVFLRHTTGQVLYGEEHNDSHDWYDDEKISDHSFWERYRRFLIEKSFLAKKSLDLLGEKTLPAILNCLANPKSEFTGKPILRRGLIIGDVQSGKTSTYIGMICKAADAGYKVIILLAGITESLRQQTQERVDEGVVGRTCLKSGSTGMDYKVGVGHYASKIPASAFTSVQRDFVSGKDDISYSISTTNSIVVFVCKKNVTVLNKLYTWLRKAKVDSTGYVDAPLLLIDDEADNASVNTRKDDCDPTKTNKLIRNICNLFTVSTYVGFTATPFANIFIDPDSVDQMKQADLFPEDFIYVLPTPSNYIGADRLFSTEGDHYSNLRYIADIEEPDYASEEYKEAVKNDIESLNRGTFYFQHKKEWDGELPDSLREAVLCFFLANVVRDLRGDSSAPRSMLINMSRFVKVQGVIKEHVEEIYHEVSSAIKYDFDKNQTKNEKLPLFKELSALWAKHFSNIKEFTVSRVLDKTNLLNAIKNIKVLVVNGSKMSNKLDYKANPHLRVIAVGGLALSRGLTLEGLLVSYFYRNTATFDVLMQMGRWFGYRPHYDDLFQVWTSQASAAWYNEISESAELLKADITQMCEQHLTPKDFGLKVRDNCAELQITASNKMRSASSYEMRVGYYGSIYDTPYLSLNAEQNRENLKEVEALAMALFEDGYQYRFADVERYKYKNVKSSEIKSSRYFADVPKDIVREFLSRINSSLLNVNFNVETILSFIDNPEHKGLDLWDIVFEGGESSHMCQIEPLSNIECAKRTLYDHGNAVQISSRRHILGTREGRFCLTANEIKQAENACRQAWIDQGLSKQEADQKDIPVKAYFKYLEKRKPILIIMPIHPNFVEEDSTKPNGRRFDGFKKALGNDQLIAFAIGFPGIASDETVVSYQVNKNWLRLNGFEGEEYTPNEEEYDG